MKIKAAYIIVVVLVGTATAKRALKKEKAKSLADTVEDDSEPRGFSSLNARVRSSNPNGTVGFSSLNGPKLKFDSNNVANDSFRLFAIAKSSPESTGGAGSDPAKQDLAHMAVPIVAPTPYVSGLNAPNLPSLKSAEAVGSPRKGIEAAEDGTPTGSPALANTNEITGSGNDATAIKPDGAEQSDSGNADDEISGGRMMGVESTMYSGYTSTHNQHPHYAEMGTYGSAPVGTYGYAPVWPYGTPVGNYGNDQLSGYNLGNHGNIGTFQTLGNLGNLGTYGNLGNHGDLGMTPQLPNILAGTYGPGMIGNYGNLAQAAGFGSIGNPVINQAAQQSVVKQHGSFTKVESYGDTPTNPVTFGQVPVGFGSNGNFFNPGENIQGPNPLAVQAQPVGPIVSREEHVRRIETRKVLDDGNPSPPATNVTSMNFNADQFSNAAALAQLGAAYPGVEGFGGLGTRFSGFGGLGSQYGGFGGFGSGFGGYGAFGGMGMMNSMMNHMAMNHQFEESNGFGGNEESSVSSSNSHHAYPVPMPIPFHMPHPQPFPVPVHAPFAVPIPVPHPYPVEKAVEVRVPVNKPYPVPVNHMVPVPFKELVTVNKPYPVHVPVEVEKPVRVEVPVPFPVPIYQQVRVPEPRPYPVHVRKNVPVPMPFPIPLPQPENNFHKMMY